MSVHFSFLRPAALAVILFLGQGDGNACQICLPYPTETLADRILEADHLVLARENPDKPYTLRPIRSLHGSAESPPMDLFLDSSTRRLLEHNESLSLLCGWDPGTKKWRRLARYDETVAPVVATILEKRETWAEAPESRVRYFADFLGHDEATLSDLAHIEVARSPYDRIRMFADRVPREDLLAYLGNFRRIEWHALYILFLAQSENPADHDRIREEIAEVAEFNLATRSAAWATALLEIDRADAVEQLRDWYGEKRTRRPEERQAILSALIVFGDVGDPALRDSLIGLMGEFLRTDPDLAPEIGAALGRWNRDDLAQPIAALLRESPERFDTDATLALRKYLREVETRSQPADSSPAAVDKRNPMLPLLALVGLFVAALLFGIGGKLRWHALTQRT